MSRDRASLERAAAELDERVEAIADRPPTDSVLPAGLRPVVSGGKGLMRRTLAWYTRWQVEQLRSVAAAAASAVRTLSSQVSEDGVAISRLERRVKGLERALEPASDPAVAVASPAARSRQVQRAVDYVHFEATFRGTEEEVARKQARYVDIFKDAPGKIVDLGCGRGEFVQLLGEAGLTAYGVDMNADMVSICQERGLAAVEGDLLEHLRALPSTSLGGIFSAQVAEHLDPDAVVDLFELSSAALAPGGRLVVETLNPTSLYTFASALYVDPGHVRPLHPLTLKFLAERAGFEEVRIEFVNPPPPGERLQLIDAAAAGDELAALVTAVNDNLRRLDGLLYGPLDFALIARRLP